MSSVNLLRYQCLLSINEPIYQLLRLEFHKTSICYYEKQLPKIRTYLMRLMVKVTDMVSKNCIIKCVNFQKILLAHFTKSCMDKKIHSGCRRDQ